MESQKIIKYFLVVYSETYILVTGDIAIVGGDDNIRSVVHFNDEHVDTAEDLDLVMNCSI